MTPSPRHGLAAVATLLTLATPTTASALPGDPPPSLDYDTEPQFGAAIAGGAVGSLVGVAVGASVGWGTYSLLCGRCGGSEGFFALVIATSGAVGTLAGSAYGATAGAWWLGGEQTDDETWSSTVAGAWGGAALGLACELGLLVVALSSGSNEAVLATAIAGPLVVGAGAGIGASLGYQLNYASSPVQDVVLTPTFGHDRAGVALGFRF